MRDSKPFAILALDPGAKFAGLAVWHGGKLKSFDWLVDLDDNRCHAIGIVNGLMLDEGLNLLVVSEYPTAGTPNGPQVRQAANVVITRLKKRFPRRVKVVKVVPQTWQSRVTKGMPGSTPKARSVARAALDYQIAEQFLETHVDIADALNILTYARGFVRWVDGK